MVHGYVINIKGSRFTKIRSLKNYDDLDFITITKIIQLNTAIKLNIYPTIGSITKLARSHVCSTNRTTRTDETQWCISLPKVGKAIRTFASIPSIPIYSHPFSSILTHSYPFPFIPIHSDPFPKKSPVLKIVQMTS
jgi:hypothetical protein